MQNDKIYKDIYNFVCAILHKKIKIQVRHNREEIILLFEKYFYKNAVNRVSSISLNKIYFTWTIVILYPYVRIKL